MGGHFGATRQRHEKHWQPAGGQGCGCLLPLLLQPASRAAALLLLEGAACTRAQPHQLPREVTPARSAAAAEPAAAACAPLPLQRRLAGWLSLAAALLPCHPLLSEQQPQAAGPRPPAALGVAAWGEHVPGLPAAAGRAQPSAGALATPCAPWQPQPGESLVGPGPTGAHAAAQSAPQAAAWPQAGMLTSLPAACQWLRAPSPALWPQPHPGRRLQLHSFLGHQPPLPSAHRHCCWQQRPPAWPLRAGQRCLGVSCPAAAPERCAGGP